MLQDDGRVGDEGPEVVGLEARVALEVLEKGGLVRVVVGACEAPASGQRRGERVWSATYTTASPT